MRGRILNYVNVRMWKNVSVVKQITTYLRKDIE